MRPAALETALKERVRKVRDASRRRCVARLEGLAYFDFWRKRRVAGQRGLD
jgi:hypothetical protein